MSWAQSELYRAEFGDARLTQRLIQLVEALARRAEASIPQACPCWAQTKAAYRFFANERATPGAIIGAHAASTADRIRTQARSGRILAIQDTTSLDFTPHPGTAGLGYLQGAHRYGLLVHTTLAVSTEGLPLGLLDQQTWVRPESEYGIKHQRKQRTTQQKESRRWIEAERASLAHVPEDVEVVLVADREADIYALVTAPRPAWAHLLIRLAQNRRTTSELGRLWSDLEALPVVDRFDLEVPRRHEAHARSGSMTPPRQARIEVRAGRVEICKPISGGIDEAASAPSVVMHAILAREIDPPQGETGITWRLLTSLAIPEAATAREVIEYYSRRWLVERFHYVLKSGCRVEELQLREASRLERALACYSLVAWRLLSLTYHARIDGDDSCDGHLRRSEWQTLTALEGKPIPAQAPSLREALGRIARLGGFLGRGGDGEPGVKVLWRGLRRLADITDGFDLARGEYERDVGNA